MQKQILTLLAVCSVAATITPALLPAARAQAAPRELYDFETDTQGFNAILIKDDAFNLDPAAKLSVTTEKDQVRSGKGTLTWSYKAEPGQFQAIVAEAKLPPGAQKMELSIKSSAQTGFVLVAREADGTSYNLAFHVPAHEWSRVSVNLDEFTLEENGKDENGKLDLDQVTSIGLFDIATLLVGVPNLGQQPELRNPRQMWLDDLRFSAERAPQATGLVKVGPGSAYLVDNMEGDAVRWFPVRVGLTDPVGFEIFPLNTSLKLMKEAAGPGMARTPVEEGGRGLRFTYNRGAKDLFALYTDLEKADLSRAHRLKLSFRVSQKSLLLFTIKEQDGSEYHHTILPDLSEGWQTQDLALGDFELDNDSKDENDKLDAAQIKELTLVDATAVLGNLPGGDTTLDLDAVSFTLK